jgi:hypothetical protein
MDGNNVSVADVNRELAGGEQYSNLANFFASLLNQRLAKTSSAPRQSPRPGDQNQKFVHITRILQFNLKSAPRQSRRNSSQANMLNEVRGAREYKTHQLP